MILVLPLSSRFQMKICTAGLVSYRNTYLVRLCSWLLPCNTWAHKETMWIKIPFFHIKENAALSAACNCTEGWRTSKDSSWKKKTVKMAVSNVRKLLEYRESFGKGVRQRSARSDTTKENAGSLPQYLYIKVVCKPVSIDFGNTVTRINAEPEVTVEQEINVEPDVIVTLTLQAEAG